MHIKINSKKVQIIQNNKIIINKGLIDKISSIYLTLEKRKKKWSYKAILPVDLSWTDSIDEGNDFKT